MLDYEFPLFDKGIKNILGIDEAGRGPLAGPMVVAGVVFEQNILRAMYEVADSQYHLINDSKKLSPKKRTHLYDFICDNAINYEIEIITNTQLDEWGISRATQIAFFNISNRTIKKLGNVYVLTDSFRIEAIHESKQTNLIRGDQLSISIAAASIIAKVTRDRIMEELHKEYPKYQFNKHKGYGTKLHMELIKKHGPCSIHRKSFEPIKSML